MTRTHGSDPGAGTAVNATTTLGRSDRVRSSVPAVLVSASWMFPMGSIGIGIVAGTVGAGPPVTVPLVLLLFLGLSWSWWRYAGVRAERRPDGIRVHGAGFRGRLTWARIVEIRVTRNSYTSVFGLREITVRFTGSGTGDVRTVTVARAYRCADAGAEKMRGWYRLPSSRHEPRVSLDESIPPVPTSSDAELAELEAAPVLQILRPSVTLRLLWTGFLAAVLPIAVVTEGVPISGGWLVVVGAIAVVLVVLAARIWRMRLELTPVGLVSYGFAGTDPFPLARIASFEMTSVQMGTAGLAVRLIDWERAEHLAVDRVRRDPERALAQLDGWLATYRASGDDPR